MEADAPGSRALHRLSRARRCARRRLAARPHRRDFGPSGCGKTTLALQTVAHAAEAAAARRRGSMRTTPSIRRMRRTLGVESSECRWRSRNPRNRRWRSLRSWPLSRRGGSDRGGFGGGAGAAARIARPASARAARGCRAACWRRDCGSCVAALRGAAARVLFLNQMRKAVRRAKARPAPAVRRSNFSRRCASRCCRAGGRGSRFRVLKNKAARRSRRANWCGETGQASWKARKMGVSAMPTCKKPAENRAFSCIFPLHHHALPL